jgi:hypothetical protein
MARRYDHSRTKLRAKAIELNPNLSQNYMWLGTATLWSGNAVASKGHPARAIALGPHDPLSAPASMYIGMAHPFIGVDEEALGWAQKYIDLPNCCYWANTDLTTALGQLTLSGGPPHGPGNRSAIG